MELRVRNRGYDFTGQRYTLRVEPHGFGETRSRRNYHEATIAYEESRRDDMLNKQLRKRYSLVVEYFYRRAVYDVRTELKEVYEDRLKILGKGKRDVDFKIDKYIDAGDDVLKTEWKIIEERSKIDQLHEEIQSYLTEGDSIAFDTADMIDMAFIDALVSTHSFGMDSANVHMRRSTASLERDRKRFELEQAQGRQYISFLEFGFDHDSFRDERKNERDGDEYDYTRSQIIELAIPIPLVNANRNDINRRKIALLDETGDHNDFVEDLQAEIIETRNEMNVLLQRYSLLMERKSEVNSAKSLKKYMKMDGVDPKKVLNAKESLLKHELTIEEVRLDIYRGYIKLLDITGMLSARPLINHLSTKRTPIELLEKHQ